MVCYSSMLHARLSIIPMKRSLNFFICDVSRFEFSWVSSLSLSLITYSKMFKSNMFFAIFSMYYSFADRSNKMVAAGYKLSISLIWGLKLARIRSSRLFWFDLKHLSITSITPSIWANNSCKPCSLAEQNSIVLIKFWVLSKCLRLIYSLIWGRILSKTPLSIKL